MSKELWVEKYRPKTVDGYVWRDDNQRNQVTGWIKSKSIPHLLFSGSAGIGKTTLAKLLLNEIGIEDYDILEINASRDNDVDHVRTKIVNFVQMIPFGPFKVVLLDEADYLSLSAQAVLRGVMEQYHETARFILTCNYPNKIIPALHSRCQGFHFEKIDPTEFTARVATILVEENVEFDLDTLDTYVKATYPDLRKCINTLQMNSSEGKLATPSNDVSGNEWRFDAINMFKAGKIGEARKFVCSKIRADEIDEMYRWLYDNVEVFGDETAQDTAILIIKQGLVDHALVIDPEINLAATLVRLARINK
jgi:DNA polymerase III delta prime subunit